MKDLWDFPMKESSGPYRYERVTPLPPFKVSKMIDHFYDEDDHDDRTWGERFGDVVTEPLIWLTVGSVALAITGIASFVAVWTLTATWNIISASWLFTCLK